MEIEVMKQLEHEHIVKLEDFEVSYNYVGVLIEFCTCNQIMNHRYKKKVWCIRPYSQYVTGQIYLKRE